MINIGEFIIELVDWVNYSNDYRYIFNLYIEFYFLFMKFNLEMYFFFDYRLFFFNCLVLEKDGEVLRKF